MPGDAWKRPNPNYPSITCPQCGATSYNANDIAQRYCGNCHQFHEDMMLPGSDRALALGCICPVLDNAHGRGYHCKPGLFVIAEGCPIHRAGRTDR